MSRHLSRAATHLAGMYPSFCCFLSAECFWRMENCSKHNTLWEFDTRRKIQYRKRFHTFANKSHSIFFDDAVKFYTAALSWKNKHVYLKMCFWITPRVVSYYLWGWVHTVPLQAIVTFSQTHVRRLYYQRSSTRSIFKSAHRSSPRPHGFWTMRGLLDCREGNKTVMVIK